MRSGCIFATLAIGLLLLIDGLTSCGGGKAPLSTAAPGMTEARLAAPERPVDVAPELWKQLTDELARVLAEYDAAHAAAQAPVGEYNRIEDLTVVTNTDGTATFSWHYKNVGDYNQDKAVTVNDLTPVGQEFNSPTDDGDDDPRQQVVDGNQDGWVTIHDITAIGQNFAHQVDGYVLEVSPENNPDGEWTQEVLIPFEDSVLPEDRGWRRFSYRLEQPEHGYYYRIAAYYDEPTRRGPASATVMFDLSAVGQPQNLTASQGTLAGQVELNWTAVSGTTIYYILRADSEDGAYSQIDQTGSGPTYTDENVAMGQVYWYRVRSLLTGGPSQPSAAAAGWSMVPPVAPTALTASDGDYTDRIELSWTAPAAADGYRVLRSDTSGSGYSELDTTTDTAYSDTTATAGEVYYYTVIASNAAGDSPPSNEDAGRREIAGTAPTVIEVSPLSGESATFVAFSAVIYGGTPDTYDWYFAGGATPNTPATAEPTVQLLGPGEFECRLTVANAFGGDTFNFTLDVTDPSQAPVITGVNPTGGNSGDVVTFGATVTQGAPQTYAWNFGGGANPNTSTVTEPTVMLLTEGSYDAWVTVGNGVGEDTYPFTLTVGALPQLAAPENVSASDGTYTDQVSISWDSVTDATGYRLYRDTTAAPLVVLGDVDSYDDDTGDWAEHEYWIKATGALADSPFSASDTGYAQLLPPANLTASDAGYVDRIRLNWNASTGATGYQIYRDSELLQTVGIVTTFDDLSLLDYDAHTYELKAFNDLSTSDLSNSDDGWLRLPTPVNLSASDGTSTTLISLSWSNVSPATGYEIYRDSQTAPIQTVGSVTGWDDATVTDHASHEYWLKATNSLGASGFSASDTGFRGLAAPATLSASDNAYTDRIRLTWTKSNGATGYKIYRDSQTAPIQTVGDVATWDDTGLSDYTAHEYWLKAVNALTESGFSASDTGNCKVPAPTNLAASDGDYTTKIHLTWTASDGATGYRIYRDSTATPIDNVGTVTQYDDTGVSDTDPHTYWLRAIGPLGDSDLSTSDTGYLAATNWDDYVVDSGTDVGEWPCLRVVAGYPMISYFDDTNNQVKFARATVAEPAAGTDWTVYTLDSSTNVGEYGTALTDLNGKPAVAYYDGANLHLKAALATSATPGSADWNKHLVDEDLANGRHPSMVTQDGKLAIAYQHFTSKDLKFARASVAVPSSGSDWAVHIVENTGNLGGDGISLIVDDNRFTIAYYKAPSGPQVRVARATVAEPTADTDWSIHTVEDTLETGHWPCLYTWSGNLVLSYVDLTNGRLRFARATADPPTSATDWVRMNVDETHTAGNYGTALVIDAAGTAHVAYFDGLNEDLLHASTTDTSCDAAADWTLDAPDTGTAAGYYPSMTLVDGYPAVAYQSNGQLKYAYFVPE